MEDRHGHRIRYLRISVTDRCNERCAYCLPFDEPEWLPREEILSYEEILRVARVAASLGVSRVRVTGGEPLARRALLGFVERLCALEGIEEVGLSTNATLLAGPEEAAAGAEGGAPRTRARALREAGVSSVNVSLDTLDPALYREITGRDYLDRAIAGIDAARAAGFEAVKINTVLMRQRNEHELWDLVDFARERELLLRFIELMPVSTTQVLTEENFLSAGEARRMLEFRFGKLIPRPDLRSNGPSGYYEVPGTGQILGFIGAMTNPRFCESCNKLRLTCDGKLRPCLGSHLEFDLRSVLRDPDADDSRLAEVFLETVERKPAEHEFRDNYRPARKMVAIGG